MDNIIFVGYLLALVVARNKLAMTALMCFMFMRCVFEFTELNALQIHIINFMAILPLLMFADKKIKLSALLYMCLQWVMAIDIYVLLLGNNMDYNILMSDESITYLYLLYPYADFMVNLVIILTIIKTQKVVRDGTISNIIHNLFTNKSNFKYISTN